MLQTRIFPEIRRYCAEKGGFSFQPIDLRWGVSQEAQLDHKTLELCLNEVRTCKCYPTPNFIILAGDRYGWVPLPYAIEKEEFESLLEMVNEDQKTKLLEWYEKDENQIPVSYLLRERIGEYVEYGPWAEVEDRLRAALQQAVTASQLPDETKKKYFLSATEAEVVEGILEYSLNPTPHQRRLLEQGLLQPGWDKAHVFAFIRNITGDISGTKYDDGHPGSVDRFKERIRSSVDAILEVDTQLEAEERLNQKYLQLFEADTLAFLKARVDLMAESTAGNSRLEIEQLASRDFLNTKLKNFQGREASRSSIAAYLSGENHSDIEHPSAPLVVYGPSGRGKSALMAKAVSEVQTWKDRKVIYRFTSVTPESSSSKGLLLSIFEELGVDLFEKDTGSEPGKTESFENFSERVRLVILNLATRPEKIVLFLDAIDQVSNPDRLLWLPERLPKNVRIVLSMLDDDKYPEDSKYYQAIEKRAINFHQIPPFEGPLELMAATLADYGCRLQLHQEVYFLQQYASSESPLFVHLAAEEMRHWRSSDAVEGEITATAEGTGAVRRVQDLADSQQALVQEFISNLHDFYHHNQEFVSRVLGYIHASRDGLSESELLQLLSADSEFIQRLAPDTWHTNVTGELPTVIWSRLAVQLRPFFRQSMQDGEVLISFFHREFASVIAGQEKQEQIHREAIAACQKLVSDHQNERFEHNRWGRLYINLSLEHELKYATFSMLEENARFIGALSNTEWVRAVYWHIDAMSDQYRALNRIRESVAHDRMQVWFTETLYDNDNDTWAYYYANAIANLALSYGKIEQTQAAIELEERNVELCRYWFGRDRQSWEQPYAIALNNLARSYGMLGRTQDAVAIQEESLTLLRILYRQSPDRFAADMVSVLNNLALLYGKLEMNNDSVSLNKESLSIARDNYKARPREWAEGLMRALAHLAASYAREEYHAEAVALEEEAVELAKILYRENPDLWVEALVNLSNNLTMSYVHLEHVERALALSRETRDICHQLYEKNPDRWVGEYLKSLEGHASACSYADRAGDAIEIQYNALSLLSQLYQDNPERWEGEYIGGVSALADSLLEIGEADDALPFMNERVSLVEQKYRESPSEWIDAYTTALNNLGFLYRTQGAYDQAVPHVHKALKIWRDNRGENDQTTATYYSSLGWLLHLKGKQTEAIELLERAVQLRTELLGADAGPTTKARERLEEVRNSTELGEK